MLFLSKGSGKVLSPLHHSLKSRFGLKLGGRLVPAWGIMHVPPRSISRQKGWAGCSQGPLVGSLPLKGCPLSWNGPPTALLCTALRGGKQRGRPEYLFTASLSTEFAKYTVCEMVIPLKHKGVISWNNFLCIMIWIDGIWMLGEGSEWWC